MIHYMNNELPSPNMIKRKSKNVEPPMVIAHFNKGELATMDRLQGGRTMDKKYGIPHYKGLKGIFDHAPFLQHLEKMHSVKRASGGSIPGMEKMKAKMGRMGDTMRAAIPRNMANFMDKMGLSTRNPHTGDREYALGSDFISSLGSYMPSMGSLASGLAKGASSAASAAPAAAASAAPAASSGSGSMLGSLFNTLAPAAINAGASYLSKPKDTAGTAPAGQTAASSPTAAQPAAANTAGQSAAPAPGGDQASMMQQLQQMLMQQGQNYLGSRNDPYSRMGAQLLGGYQRGGFQGMMPQTPQAGYEMFNNMMGGRMPQMNFGGYGPQMDAGYSPEQYQAPMPQMAPNPSRRGSSSRRAGYR